MPGTEPAWGLPWGVNRAREPIVIVPGRGGRAQGHLRGAAGGSGQGGAGREQRLQGEHLAGGLLFAQTLLPTPWFSIPGHRLASSWERVSWSFATFGGIRCLDVRPLTSACRVPPAPPRGPCGGRKRPCSPPPHHFTWDPARRGWPSPRGHLSGPQAFPKTAWEGEEGGMWRVAGASASPCTCCPSLKLLPALSTLSNPLLHC